MTPTLIIDCHAICHAVKHTIGDLSHEEQKVGIIFGFLKQILSLSKRFETNQFLFCWDSKRSLRKEMYPSYKTRPKISQEDYAFEKFAYSQFAELRMKTIPKFGFKNSFIQTGLEADDIIAIITLTYEKDFVIVSGDQDLYQLLSPNVRMFSTKTKKITTVDSFKDDWNVTPQQWAMVKQIAGCTSDTVEGIAGVGNKTAVKYLNNVLGKKTKAFNNIIQDRMVIQRNEALVKLPFKGTKLPQLQENELFHVADFIELTDWYGFRSFQQIELLNSWITNFNMK
jgi:DNA polymerase I